MTRLGFLAAALLALAFACSPTRTGRSADDSNAIGVQPADPKVSSTDDAHCVIYALADRGYDSDLGEWIAQTVPDMIEPRSWRGCGGTGVLRYYAPKNILIIKNSAAVHAKLEGFLKDLKKSLPKGSKTLPKGSKRDFASGQKWTYHSVVPAEYTTPAPLQSSRPVPQPSSYPVPPPVKPPKHLFHFIIRYEGDGIIDNNVVKAMKAYSDSTTGPAGGPSYAGGVCTPAGMPSVSPPVGLDPLPPSAYNEATATKEKKEGPVKEER